MYDTTEALNYLNQAKSIKQYDISGIDSGLLIEKCSYSFDNAVGFNGDDYIILDICDVKSWPHGISLISEKDMRSDNNNILDKVSLNSVVEAKVMLHNNSTYIMIDKSFSKPIVLKYSINSNVYNIVSLYIVQASGVKNTIVHYMENFSKDFIFNINFILQPKSELDVCSVNNLLSNKIFEHCNFYLAEEADARLTNIDFRVKNSHKIVYSAIGELANMQLRNLYIGKGNDLMKTMHISDHYAKGATSDCLTRQIANDSCWLDNINKIIIRENCPKVNAEFNGNSMLLSSLSRINNSPFLEISSDDVKCAHGVTMCNLDADHLFYLQSRGLSLDVAKKILLEGFALDVLENNRLPEILSSKIIDLTLEVLNSILQK